MEHKKILNVLVIILVLSCVTVMGVIFKLRSEIFYLPGKAADDIVKILAESNIKIDRELVGTQKERGSVYVCNTGDYNTTVAGLLSGEKVKYVFAIPEGELIVMDNGARFEFGGGFSFRYTRSGKNESVTDAVIAYNFSERPSEQKIAEITSVVTDFMERGSEEFKVGGSMDIITSVERIWENGGKYYALCSRSIGGVEVNDNKVFCTVESGEVISASGTWCFLTIGDSYSAQLCDIINILFNVKKELGASENEVTIKAIEKCYSLYTYGENEDFCLIPCMKVVTDNAGELIYNAIDGTIYTKK